MLNKPCGCDKGATFSRRDVLKAGAALGIATLAQLAIASTPAIALGLVSEIHVQLFDPATSPCARYVPDLPEEARRELYQHANANGGRIVYIKQIHDICRSLANGKADPAPLPDYPPQRIEALPAVEVPVRFETPKFQGGA